MEKWEAKWENRTEKQVAKLEFLKIWWQIRKIETIMEKWVAKL